MSIQHQDANMAWRTARELGSPTMAYRAVVLPQCDVLGQMQMSVALSKDFVTGIERFRWHVSVIVPVSVIAAAFWLLLR